jgi:hypothetical protein
MHDRGLFDFGNDLDDLDDFDEEELEKKYYFVVGVRADAWDSNGE